MATKKTAKRASKATRASKGDAVKAESQPGDVFKVLPLSEVHADFAWNVRSGDWQHADVNGDAGEHSFVNLCESIAEEGQDTPVLVRPRKSGKGYDLVSGFRRYAAIAAIAKGDKDKGWEPNKKPTISVLVRTMNDIQARTANIRENTARDDLGGPDLAWAIGDLMRQYKSATGSEPSSVQLAAQIGRNQSYVNKLMGIMRDVCAEVLELWRSAGGFSVSTDKLKSIAKEKDEKAQVEKFKKFAADKKESSKGPAAWVDGAKTKMARIGMVLGTLERQDLIGTEGLSFVTHMDTFDECLGFLKKPDAKGNGGATSAQRKAIAKAAQDAYNEAFASQVHVEDEDED